MVKKSVTTKLIPTWLLLIVVLGSIVATAVAMNLISLQVQKINIFGGQYQYTQFSITAIDTHLKGKNKILITLDIRNTDENPHSCTVTLQLLDDSGNVIVISSVEMSQTETITDLEGSATQQLTYTFNGAGLVAQYDQGYVIIKQTA